ncbi:MAG: ISL3 family transposase [Actinobacteria bacterium]|nr:ISL3 family transposase [Actinomycetota bacterium]
MANRIDVPLELDGFEVMSSEVIGDVLEVEVRSVRRPACHHCGSVDVIGHGRNERRIRDRACVYPTVLRWSQRRFRCRDCRRTCRERHPELAGQRSITNRFRYRLFERAIEQPFVHVASSEEVSCYRVFEAFEAHALEALVEPIEHPPRVVSIDESAFRKRHRYHTVFSDPERGVVFDLADGRNKGSALQGFLRMNDQLRAGIETVVMDCHWPYRRAVEELLPQARVVADKFHVIKAVDRAADKVRVKHGRRRTVVGRDGGFSRQHNPRFIPAVWRNRWTFLKRVHKLTVTERAVLDALFVLSPQMGVAWLMKEAFAAIYEAPDRTEAERRLDVWIHNLDAAGLEELSGLWSKSLGWWREQILNYFDDRVTNAFAEGITNKIKVMKRSAYGFRNPQRYRHKVLLSCRHRRSRGA